MTRTADAPARAPVWDHPNGAGLALSMIIPLVAVVAGNGVMLSLGSIENPDYAAIPARG